MAVHLLPPKNVSDRPQRFGSFHSTSQALLNQAVVPDPSDSTVGGDGLCLCLSTLYACGLAEHHLGLKLILVGP